MALTNYGVVVPNGALGMVAGLVEKPKFEEVPSNLAMGLVAMS